MNIHLDPSLIANVAAAIVVAAGVLKLISWALNPRK